MKRVRSWVVALLNGHTPHECPECWHIMPSQRRDWHRGVSRFYVMVCPREGVETVA